jgi:Cft2 family RNA processing exonuclease
VIPLKYALPRFLDKAEESLEITLHQAGHVAGAASVEFKWRGERILHTGDILFDALRHLPGAKPPEGPFSVLITETTRGSASRPGGASREDETMRLLESIEKTIARGGSVLIPVFALGRAQEMFCILHESRKMLPRVPIFSAGLGLDLAEKFDEITRKTGLIRFRAAVLRDLKVRVLERDMKPGRSPRQGIYLLSSGMMTESTPSYMAAASLLHDPKSTVCIVGYCDPDTPGGVLMGTETGENFVFEKLDYQTPLAAAVERFDLSGHADREQLLSYAESASPAKVLLIHGEDRSRERFRENLAKALSQSEIVIPRQWQCYEL